MEVSQIAKNKNVSKSVIKDKDDMNKIEKLNNIIIILGKVII